MSGTFNLLLTSSKDCLLVQLNFVEPVPTDLTYFRPLIPSSDQFKPI